MKRKLPLENTHIGASFAHGFRCTNMILLARILLQWKILLNTIWFLKWNKSNGMPGITDHKTTTPSAERTYKITYIYRGSQKMSLAENNLQYVQTWSLRWACFPHFSCIVIQPLFAFLVGWKTLQPLRIVWSLNTTCWKGRENISWSFCLVVKFRSFYHECKNMSFITGRMLQTERVRRMYSFFKVIGWTSQTDCSAKD